ncbi:hypothetical protein BN2497_9861 [Janthinobacterium sp. CG23_2]|nr:hypothetical protein BN2497_9861 [Janthinobacterium sp. CG23_2]CUU31328.1 hypothetical protein BN3177_9861 [Janthinobacterium sp. CG23_2]
MYRAPALPDKVSVCYRATHTDFDIDHEKNVIGPKLPDVHTYYYNMDNY